MVVCVTNGPTGNLDEGGHPPLSYLVKRNAGWFYVDKITVVISTTVINSWSLFHICRHDLMVTFNKPDSR